MPDHHLLCRQLQVTTKLKGKAGDIVTKVALLTLDTIDGPMQQLTPCVPFALSLFALPTIRSQPSFRARRVV